MTLSMEFMAGLITGEGSFCLGVNRRKHGATTIIPIFALFMCDRDTIESLAHSLRENGLPVYVTERPKAGRGQIGIHISGMKRARRYCEAFIPLLTGQKKKAAELVLEFINEREANPSNRWNEAGISDRQKDIVHELRAVNGNTNGRKNPL